MDFAPNYTPRYKATYVAAGITHTMQFRFARGTSSGDTANGGKAACEALANNMTDVLPEDFAFISAQYALTDSDVFLPATAPVFSGPGEIVVSGLTPVERILSTTWSAKSSGSKTRVSLYCPDWDQEAPGGSGERGVIQSPADSHAATVATALNGLAIKPCGGDGQVAAWYARATVKVNDHLLRLVRRGLLG